MITATCSSSVTGGGGGGKGRSGVEHLLADKLAAFVKDKEGNDSCGWGLEGKGGGNPFEFEELLFPE